MKSRGHPIRGAVAGLFFGLFVSLDLVIFGVVALDADILAVLPILGLAAGIVLGLMAPLHRRRSVAEVELEDQAISPQPVEMEPAEPRRAEPAPAMAMPVPESDHTTA